MTPATNWYGSANILLKVEEDDEGLFDTEIFTLNVESVNDPPLVNGTG